MTVQYAALVRTEHVVMERLIGVAHLVGMTKGLESGLEKKTDGMTAGILRGSKKGEAVQVGKEGQKRQQLFRE